MILIGIDILRNDIFPTKRKRVLAGSRTQDIWLQFANAVPIESGLGFDSWRPFHPVGKLLFRRNLYQSVESVKNNKVYLHFHRLIEFQYLKYILLSCLHSRPDTIVNNTLSE